MEYSVFVEVVTKFLFPVRASVPLVRPRRYAPVARHDVREFSRLKRRIIARVTIAKSLRKDLVEDSIRRPVRNSTFRVRLFFCFFGVRLIRWCIMFEW